MLTRADLVSPSAQDKNAGNSGDLVKHAVYLAMLQELSRFKPDTKPHVVEAHGGKGVYVTKHCHLKKARHLAGYEESGLGLAEDAVFAPPPSGVGAVQGLQQDEVAYAGSAVLHACSVVGGTCSSLTVLDHDAGVRRVVARVFAEPCFSAVRDRLLVEDPGTSSEPEVLSRIRRAAFGAGHIVHLDPFAFVMAQKDAHVRGWYGELLGECDARVGRGELLAASAFITWGSNGAAAKDDLYGAGYLGGMPGGYQALVKAVDPSRRLIVTWCWELFFSLLLIVPADSKAAVSRAIASETEWLRPATSRLQIS